MNANVLADVQIACEAPGVPSQADMEAWLAGAQAEAGISTVGLSEVGIRIVDEAESQSLNLNYRDKDQSTNVLAFPVSLPDITAWPSDMAIPLGDLVICAPVIEREAAEQGKELAEHWGHMLVHGMLHLLGYDHETETQAQTMESLEVRILRARGVQNPYEDK